MQKDKFFEVLFNFATQNGKHQEINQDARLFYQ